MKRRNFAPRPGCAVEATLDLIDGKWKGVILYHLQAVPSALANCGG
jgi:DNA-binding HxlR family transcriptional regulator